MRMHAQTAMIENGLVHLPKEAAWLAEYLPFAIPVGIGSVGWRGRLSQPEIYQVLRRHQSRQPVEAGRKPDICRGLWRR